MVQAYYDADADVTAIAGEVVGILGYGIQGRAQALNLRDAGLRIVVGNRDDAYRAQAVADGFVVHDIGEAAARADLVLVLIPDEVQAQVYAADIAPALRPGQALVFAHGFAIRYGLIAPPPAVDLLLLAPRLPGQYVRSRFLAGHGVPAFAWVEHDATGRGWARVLGLAKALGFTRAGVLAVSFAQETELDHFSEHFTLPLIFRALQLAFEALVAAGYPPEVALMELHGSSELGEVLVEASRSGLWRMLQTHGSPACQFGVHHYADRVLPDSTRATIEQVLREIQDGTFARELLAEQAAGYPRLRRATDAALAHEMTQAEAALRRLLHVTPQSERAEDGDAQSD